MLHPFKDFLNKQNACFFKKFDLKNTRYPDAPSHTMRLVLVDMTLGRIYLQRLNSADPEKSPHNHPWVAFSVILHGGYTEEVWTKTGIIHRSYKRGSINKLKTNEFHRIISVKPNTWTLLIGGKYKSSWGFWTQSGYVDWIQHQYGSSINSAEQL